MYCPYYKYVVWAKGDKMKLIINDVISNDSILLTDSMLQFDNTSELLETTEQMLTKLLQCAVIETVTSIVDDTDFTIDIRDRVDSHVSVKIERLEIKVSCS